MASYGNSGSGKLQHKPGYYCPRGGGPSLPQGWSGKYTDAKTPYNRKK